jgi:hypothetical protein
LDWGWGGEWGVVLLGRGCAVQLELFLALYLYHFLYLALLLVDLELFVMEQFLVVVVGHDSLRIMVFV